MWQTRKIPVTSWVKCLACGGSANQYFPDYINTLDADIPACCKLHAESVMNHRKYVKEKGLKPGKFTEQKIREWRKAQWLGGNHNNRDIDFYDTFNTCFRCKGAGCELCKGTGVPVPKPTPEEVLKTLKQKLSDHQRKMCKTNWVDIAYESQLETAIERLEGKL